MYYYMSATLNKMPGMLRRDSRFQQLVSPHLQVLQQRLEINPHLVQPLKSLFLSLQQMANAIYNGKHRDVRKQKPASPEPAEGSPFGK